MAMASLLVTARASGNGGDVNRWHASRRKFAYIPVMQFYLRFVMFNFRDALRMRADEKPKDDALLARNWFATEVRPGGEDYGTSFSCCCHILERDQDVERMAALEMIDKAGDFDTEECDARLAILLASPLYQDDVQPVLEGFRCVPALDQGTLFGGMIQ